MTGRPCGDPAWRSAGRSRGSAPRPRPPSPWWPPRRDRVARSRVLRVPWASLTSPAPGDCACSVRPRTSPQGLPPPFRPLFCRQRSATGGRDTRVRPGRGRVCPALLGPHIRAAPGAWAAPPTQAVPAAGHSAALTMSGWGPWRFPWLWSPWKWLETEGRRSGGPTGLTPGDCAASLAAGRVGLRPACGPTPPAWGPTESPPAGETLHVVTQACRGRGDGKGRRAWAIRPPPELGGDVGFWKRRGSSLSPHISRARVGRHRRAPRCFSGPWPAARGRGSCAVLQGGWDEEKSSTRREPGPRPHVPGGGRGPGVRRIPSVPVASPQRFPRVSPHP